MSRYLGGGRIVGREWGNFIRFIQSDESSNSATADFVLCEMQGNPNHKAAERLHLSKAASAFYDHDESVLHQVIDVTGSAEYMREDALE
jgi:hypothetical protein